MRLGVFGGTFNPPHIGHRIVAEQAVEALSLQRLLWIPAARSPFKDGSRDVSAAHRLAMTMLAASDHAAFRVSDLELQRPPPSYTVDTLRELHQTHPNAELILLVGEDSWNGFSGWHQPEEILRLARIAVYPRPGNTSGRPPAAPDFLLDAPAILLSSSEIRRKLIHGEPVAGLLAPAVVDYIRKFDLYPSSS